MLCQTGAQSDFQIHVASNLLQTEDITLETPYLREAQTRTSQSELCRASGSLGHHGPQC